MTTMGLCKQSSKSCGENASALVLTNTHGVGGDNSSLVRTTLGIFGGSKVLFFISALSSDISEVDMSPSLWPSRSSIALTNSSDDRRVLRGTVSFLTLLMTSFSSFTSSTSTLISGDTIFLLLATLLLSLLLSSSSWGSVLVVVIAEPSSCLLDDDTADFLGESPLIFLLLRLILQLGFLEEACCEVAAATGVEVADATLLGLAASLDLSLLADESSGLIAGVIVVAVEVFAEEDGIAAVREVLTTRTWQGFLPSLNLTISLTGGRLSVAGLMRSSGLGEEDRDAPPPPEGTGGEAAADDVIEDEEEESMEGFLCAGPSLLLLLLESAVAAVAVSVLFLSER